MEEGNYKADAQAPKISEQNHPQKPKGNDGKYKATPNTSSEMSPQDSQQQEINQDERNIQNNENNLRNASKVAQHLGPYGKAASAIFEFADKFTHGKSTKELAKGLNTANKIVPGGKKTQKALNKLNESGASDMIGTAASIKSGGTGGAANISKAQKAQNTANKLGETNNKLDSIKGNSSSSSSSGSKGMFSDGDILSKNMKIKIMLYLLPVIGGILAAMFLFILLFGPNMGSTLDLTSDSKTTNMKSTEYSKAEIENLMVYVGDSRIVGMSQTLSNSTVSFIAESGANYEWLTSTGITQIETEIALGRKHFILNLGLYDINNIDNYISYYISLEEKYTDINFYYMSVNPIDELLAYANGHTITSDQIESFNKKLKSEFGKKYIDTYNSISISTTDGIHYDTSTNNMIHEIVTSKLIDNNKKTTSDVQSDYPTVSGSSSLAGDALVTKIGDAGIKELEASIISAVGSGCSGNSVANAATALIDGLYQKGYHIPYYWGGGHTENNPIVNPNWGGSTTCVVSSGGNTYCNEGLDCSGFVLWAMQAAKVSGIYQAADFLNLGSHIPYSDLTPGDVIANQGHVILVLKNNGTTLTTAESNKAVQFSSYNYTYLSNNGYTGVDMDNYYQTHCRG